MQRSAVAIHHRAHSADAGAVQLIDPAVEGSPRLSVMLRLAWALEGVLVLLAMCVLATIPCLPGILGIAPPAPEPDVTVTEHAPPI